MSADETHSSSVHPGSESAGRDGPGAAEPPWDLIAERIDAFAAAWDASLVAEGGVPPRLGEFVASLPNADARHVLVELVKLDLERRFEHDLAPRNIEDYVRELPQLGSVEQLPVDLVYEELQGRMLAGRTVYQEEVRERFPKQAESILRLLGGLALSGSPTATYFADALDTVADPQRGKTPINANKVAAFAHLKPGDVIDDFQLIAPLGSGAFARVFLARQTSMERMVALKISASVGSEPQTLAQLDHPNIVRVFDQRSCADPPARLLYMEVVSGGTLQDVIQRGRDAFDGKLSGLLLLGSVDEKLSAVGATRPESSSARDWIEDAAWPEVVARLGAEMAEGLGYAHSRGVLHRDLKPANVLLSAEAKPKLADFNVSYNGGRSDENPEDTFGGSLAYMSPEQLEACHPLLGGSPRLVRAQSDVYALGVMLWELLTGRRPFRDEKVAADGGALVKLQRMIEVRRGAELARLASELPKECPASLRAVLVKALEPDTAKRYATADELARALRLCLNPRCWDLLAEPRSKLGRLILRRPVLSLVFAGLAPNILTAVFNFNYNLSRIRGMGTAMENRFWEAQAWINTIAFSLGVGIGLWVAIKAFRLLKDRRAGVDPEASSEILFFGRFIAILVVILWSVSGIVFPIAVGWGKESHEVGFYLHFFLSLAICGAAATSYPYFLDTTMAVHYFIPSLVRKGAITGPKRADLKAVLRLNRFFLGISGLVPFLGMLLMVVFSDEKADLANSQKWALITVSAGGLIGLGAMFLLDRLITLDIAALDHIAVDEPRGPGSRSSIRSRGSRRSA